jgi:hypothetical protein|uniref:Uncharacterized protein n=1 Tax=Populus trichocarpa TaxID=3694 RepID=A0A3N7E9H4_POPTR
MFNEEVELRLDIAFYSALEDSGMILDQLGDQGVAEVVSFQELKYKFGVSFHPFGTS